MSPNVEAAGLSDCLLKPLALGHYANALASSDVSKLQGVALYYDKQRARFCRAIVVHGKDKSFGKQHGADLVNSKGRSKGFAQLYPYTKPHNPEKGRWKELFSDLDLYVGLALDLTAETECLTRAENGLFVWSEATLNKLSEAKIAGANDLKTKQIAFVCCMLQLTYDLMLEKESNVPEVPFKPFIGRSMNLRSNANA